jgi:hypothetical protein
MNINSTPKAREAERAYNHIYAFLADNGYPPRRKDICDDLGREHTAGLLRVTATSKCLCHTSQGGCP